MEPKSEQRQAGSISWMAHGRKWNITDWLAPENKHHLEPVADKVVNFIFKVRWHYSILGRGPIHGVRSFWTSLQDSFPNLRRIVLQLETAYSAHCAKGARALIAACPSNLDLTIAMQFCPLGSIHTLAGEQKLNGSTMQPNTEEEQRQMDRRAAGAYVDEVHDAVQEVVRARKQQQEVSGGAHCQLVTLTSFTTRDGLPEPVEIPIAKRTT